MGNLYISNISYNFVQLIDKNVIPLNPPILTLFQLCPMCNVLYKSQIIFIFFVPLIEKI